MLDGESRVTDKAKRLEDFVAWNGNHIKGDEKGEAQVYLDRLFQGFGHAGFPEVGATCEERVKKGETGSTSFADLVWKPSVVIEMTKRGVDLKKHYRQAFEYWTYMVPNRPRYAVLWRTSASKVHQLSLQTDDVALLDQIA